MAGHNMRIGKVFIEVVFTNPSCAGALRYIMEAADSLAEDLTWREEPKRMKRAAKYLLRHMNVISTRGPQ